MKPLVIFDLDGTLADSKRDLCASVNRVRSEFGMGPLGDDTIAAMVGDGVAALIARALAGASNGDAKAGVPMFLAHYRDHMLDETCLYPGVEAVLDALADCPLAVLTNKPYRFSCRMLEGLGVYDRFAVVYGGNSLPRKKPDPMGILRIIDDTGADRASTWMVGDSAVDVLAGRAAGVRTCGVTYGYAAHTFASHPPDRRIDAFSELPGVVLGA